MRPPRYFATLKSTHLRSSLLVLAMDKLNDFPSSLTKAEHELLPTTPEVQRPDPSSVAEASPGQYTNVAVDAAYGDLAYLESQFVDDRRRASSSERCLKAFGAIILVWIILIVSIHGKSGLAYWLTHWRPNPESNELDIGWPAANDGKIIECISGSKDWLQEDSSARASFDLPLSADVLYMFSRGRLSKGNVLFDQSSGLSKDQQNIHVDVDIQYNSTAQLDATSVCIFEREKGQIGIGFLTVANTRAIPQQDYFVVKVQLPASSDGQPIAVQSFQTSLPRFTQHVADLRGGVYFHSLVLRSTHSSITAKSLSAHHAELSTTNGAIEGDFYTSGDLELITTNGPIKANGSLYYYNNSTDVSLTMRSSNGPVESRISLFSGPAKRGDFNVLVETTRGRMNLDFDTSPLDARLKLLAKTTDSPATISMNRVLEGTYKLVSNGKITVPFYSFAEDSSGQGRVRALLEAHQNGYVEGFYTRQGIPYHGGQGNTVVETTNAPITLSLL
ncbi:hypothetical protein WOLCODRAFT_166424 [Wolfiporia cocos MD-104 SS10]|uniref:Uncharacterized protein n=1 Tax=Wolfiporia cocos (strain MD-104) TaxID=742152 RepID=A0A2H3JI67_WOLCO|nr:hypothetical protein WOLCODRAFT_166424 [Wolfiporia cocos MD-104 SS10]